VVPTIVRGLHTNPGIWEKINSPWREMDELRQEAAQGWAFSAKSAQPPPDNIRKLVEELQKP
jgi:DNA-directed RNA polymerase subunit F